MRSYLDRLREVECVIFDIDGVMTDGRIGFAAGLEGEVKFFDVKDGQAIKLLSRAGIKVGALSGRSSLANRIRVRELGLDFLYEGEKDKLSAFTDLLGKQQLRAEQCLYMGDDLADLPVMRRCLLGIAVADAVEEVRQNASYVTTARGGRGAVREVAVALLKARGGWEKAVEEYWR